MNKGYDPSEINRIKELCKKAGKPFIFRPDAEKDDDHANFLFVGKYEGKEVVYDAFIYTLELEYFSNLFDEARQAVVELHPQYANADFDAAEGEHLDLLDQTMDEMAQDDAFDVQEFIELDEDADYGVSIDVCLNVEEVSDTVITKFVNEYNAGKLELDDSFYSFVLEDE